MTPLSIFIVQIIVDVSMIMIIVEIEGTLISHKKAEDIIRRIRWDNEVVVIK